MLYMIIFGISKHIFAKNCTCASKKIVIFGLRRCVPNETMFNP